MPGGGGRLEDIHTPTQNDSRYQCALTRQMTPEGSADIIWTLWSISIGQPSTKWGLCGTYRPLVLPLALSGTQAPPTQFWAVNERGVYCELSVELPHGESWGSRHYNDVQIGQSWMEVRDEWNMLSLCAMVEGPG